MFSKTCNLFKQAQISSTLSLLVNLLSSLSGYVKYLSRLKLSSLVVSGFLVLMSTFAFFSCCIVLDHMLGLVVPRFPFDNMVESAKDLCFSSKRVCSSPQCSSNHESFSAIGCHMHQPRLAIPISIGILYNPSTDLDLPE